MGSSPTSETDLPRLRAAVRGDGARPGLDTILPLLQTQHRRELRKVEHWSKEELVRHPEPRELIRAMRKAGNLDANGLPVYTLDERRVLTADIYENRVVQQVVGEVRRALAALADEDVDAAVLLLELDGAIGQAPFLLDVAMPERGTKHASATLTGDPLYRAVVALRP